jgi:hypothetical protein
MKDIHSCSYFCDRPECVKAQRDELRDKLAALEERLEIAETNNLNDTIAFNMLRKEHADLEKWFADANKKIYYLELYGNKDCTAQAMQALAAEHPKGGNNDW